MEELPLPEGWELWGGVSGAVSSLHDARFCALETLQNLLFP